MDTDGAGAETPKQDFGEVRGLWSVCRDWAWPGGGRVHVFIMNSIASISDLQAEAPGLVKQAEAEGVVPIS